jgi:hypothetical protein
MSGNLCPEGTGELSPGFQPRSLYTTRRSGVPGGVCQMISIPRATNPESKVAKASSLYRATNQLRFFGSRRSGAIVLEPEREPTVVDARYRLEAYATLRSGLARQVLKSSSNLKRPSGTKRKPAFQMSEFQSPALKRRVCLAPCSIVLVVLGTRSYRALRDGSFGRRFSRHFVPGYDRTVPPGQFATGLR